MDVNNAFPAASNPTGEGEDSSGHRDHRKVGARAARHGPGRQDTWSGQDRRRVDFQ
jgi:hypothetical protein